MHSARWGEINEVADRLFPLPLSKDQKKLPRVAELLKLAGNASNGKLVYDKAGTCAKCHIARGAGSEVGPELTEIGSKLSRQGMFESILFPSSGISHNYESWSVLTLDGNLYTGVIVSETDKLLVLKDAEGVERRIEVADIEDKQQQKLSLMPDDLHKELTAQDLADLVEYLMQLKKAQK